LTTVISLQASPVGQSALLVHGLTTHTGMLPVTPPTVITCDSQIPAWVQSAFEAHGPLQ
jgi:hypothetical protein